MNILITGAANGIGKSVCESLLENEKNTIFALDICEFNYQHSNLKTYSCDICDIESLNQIFLNLKNKNITLDVIINIAGIFIIDSFIEVSSEELHKIFNVNLFGTININKIFFPLLKENGRRIITSSEVAPLDPMPFNGIYNVTKTAIDSYSQALRQELNFLGYKVITIRPGAFDTKLANNSLIKTKELMNKTNLYKNHSKKFYIIVKKFMGKPKDPKKIAKVYLKAVYRKKPKLIYKKNTNKLLALLNILPKRLQCFIIKLIVK